MPPTSYPGSPRDAGGRPERGCRAAIRALALAVSAGLVSACAAGPGPSPGDGEPSGPRAVPAALPAPAPAADPGPLPEAGRLTRPASEREGLDVRHYDVALDLRRMADTLLSGRTRVTFTATGRDSLRLDLVGLEVDSIRLDGRRVPHRHERGVLALALGSGDAGSGPGRRPGPGATDARTVEVFYHGRPRDGMVFGTDRNGRALAFADNWPNRARWWFPGNDHPSDKATVRFDVRVPAGWGVVANGRLRSGPTPLEDAGVRWVWGTEVPIPTYTMVVGAARFARASLGPAACGRAPVAAGRCVDSSVWALPGDSAFGVERFRRAPDMLDFYAGRFGPFPYAKLAHVQSGTRFGGMENASAIFYARRPWAERTMGEGVIAHEIVHQWYGDSATPARWRHLWLSEGFATYFAAVYFGARDGQEAYRERMERAAREYLASDAVDRPVVDPTRDLYSLLNANSYQKGARVLHGLRGLVGDSAFVRGVRRFWRRHRDATATTADFRRVMEETAGRDLGWFFHQWIRSPGYPRLEAEWWIEDGPGNGGGPTPGTRGPSGDGPGAPATLVLEVRQTQPEAWPAFRLPTRVRIATSTGESRRADVTVSGRVDTLRVPLRRAEAGAGVEAVELDPGGWILKTLEMRRRARVPAGS